MLCSMKFDGLVKLFRGTALCIPQLNRIIFVNNSLILAKGRSARLSRRRALGLSALARKTCRSRARARAIDRREIDIQKWRKCWVFALLFPVPLLRHQESFPIPVESTHWGAAREFDFRDEFAADSPLQRRVRVSRNFSLPWLEAGFSRECAGHGGQRIRQRRA